VWRRLQNNLRASKERLADVVNGLVLLAQLDDCFPHRILGFGSAPDLRGEKELAMRVLAELMDQDAKTAECVAKTLGCLRLRHTIDKIGPQGFVLAVRGVARNQKGLGQVR